MAESVDITEPTADGGETTQSFTLADVIARVQVLEDQAQMDDVAIINLQMELANLQPSDKIYPSETVVETSDDE